MNERANLFKVLGDETRLRLINVLLAGGQALCVCEMVDALRLPQYCISRHLAAFRHCNLLSVHHEGTWAYYALDEQRPGNALLFEFLKSYLQDEPFKTDSEYLKARLALRKDNKCVIGCMRDGRPCHAVKRNRPRR